MSRRRSPLHARATRPGGPARRAADADAAPAALPGGDALLAARPGRWLAEPRLPAAQRQALARQLGARGGNRALQRLLAPVAPSDAAVPTLSPAQAKAARAAATGRLDHRSIRVIQAAVEVTPDGDFGPLTAQAVAAFQHRRRLAPTGLVDAPTVDAVIAARRAVDPDDPGHNAGAHAILLVADFFDLALADAALSARADRALQEPFAVHFAPGGLRVIRLGRAAMTDTAAIRAALEAALAAPAPAAPDAGPRPSHLTPGQEWAAVAYNRQRLADPRAIRVLQGVVGSAPDGVIGPDTVERLAAYQAAPGEAALEPDGKLGLLTLHRLYADLVGQRELDALIRLLIDYFDLPITGLVAIHFSPKFKSASGDAAGAVAADTPARATRVIVGPAAFAGTLTECVHTLAHELEHVRLNLQGVDREPVHEFHARVVELIAPGMPQKPWLAFLNTAGGDVLTRYWREMTAAEKAAAWAHFTALREHVRARLSAPPPEAEPAHLDLAEAVLAAYDRETKPAPGGGAE